MEQNRNPKKDPKAEEKKTPVTEPVDQNADGASVKDIALRSGKTISKFSGKILTYILNIFLTILLIGIITGSVMAAALVVYIKNYVDPVFDIDNLQYNSSLTTFLYYEEEQEDGSVKWVEWEDERIYGTENRMWVSYDEMPEDLINAFVSIEDKRFFTHQGVDIRRTVGAVLGFVTGNDSYGGSTITQQLIKNVTGDDDVTIQRKIQEILRALNLEGKRSKQEILEMYLNTIYLAEGCYGVSAAAYEYFGKDVSELTLVECASLASIPQNPTKWNPNANPELNDRRRDTVLEEMYKNNDIEKTYTREEIDAAQDEELVLRQGSGEQSTAKNHSWFVDTLIYDVIADLQETYNYDEQTAKNLLYSGGLNIYTTLDPVIQEKLDAIYEDEANFPSHGTGVQVQSAMTIMDQTTGNIVALVGGRGEKDPLGFNRATQAKRQPGSAIKPLSVYTLALEKGLIHYSTVLDDIPFKFAEVEDEETGKISYDRWPDNYNRAYDGLVTISYAVRQSKNTIAVQVLDMIGTKNSMDFLTDKYHISTLVKSDQDYAPLALGGLTYGVTNRELCTAYASIANNGIYNESKTYTKVTSSDGKVLLDSSTKSTEIILSEDTCAVTTKLLQEVVSNGTATSISLRRKIDVAGKTGTTTNNYDVYFCGYTPYYTAACWVGYDNPRTLTGFTSGQTRTGPALYLWDAVMTSIHEDIIAEGNVKRFSDNLTKNLVTRTYCRDSGLLIGDHCAGDLRGSRASTGYYTWSNMPTEKCKTHIPVAYCVDHNAIAGPDCVNIKTVSMLDVKRQFPTDFAVYDAQYCYVAVPEGTKFPLNTSLCFYAYSYPKDTYPGYTSLGSKSPANVFCTKHNPSLCIPDPYASSE